MDTIFVYLEVVYERCLMAIKHKHFYYKSINAIDQGILSYIENLSCERKPFMI